MIKNLHTKTDNQAGVAILLVVMIVSGIIIITTTVAYFVIQEIRLNRGTSLTEPAIMAAETAGENGVFRSKRGALSNCGSGYDSAADAVVNGTALGVRTRTCVIYTDAIFQFSDVDPLVLYLYDPDDINGNLCMEQTCPDDDGGGSGSQKYESIIFEYMSGGFSINVDIVTLDGVSYKSGVINPVIGDETTFTIDYDIAGSVDERLKITLTPTAKDVTVKIRTTGQHAGPPDYQTLDAEGCVGFVTTLNNCDATTETYSRRLNITLPK